MLPTLLPFEKLPVAILVIGSYLAAIIATVVVQERLPTPPPRERGTNGLDLSDAWRDLQAIAQSPHPYNSPQNDEAGKYIAQRLQHIHKGNEAFMQLDIDLATNGSWYTIRNEVTYMESRNIIVKFEGSKWNNSAVLFSAHYDTSSLAPGATDNSIAVVSLIQMAKYLASSRPERSIILLFNDGEEDGLNGAHIFLRHPWAKIVESVVNIDGAGSGGRPNLFRSSSAQLTWAFGTSAHPHGSSLFSDAFKLGLISSTTDYDVYRRAKIPAADYAFYTNRHKYHTMDDTVSSLHDRRPLWAMMENLHGVVSTLAHEQESNASVDRHFVYFDLFGEDIFYMRSDIFIVFNILLLLLGPVVVAFLAYSLHRSRKIYFTLRGSFRFLLGLIIGIVMAGICSAWYAENNPLIIYKSPYLVLTTIASLTILGTLLPIYLTYLWSPMPVQSAQVQLEMCAFWWVICIVNLVFMARNSIFGGYFITFFFAASLSACVITLLDLHRLDPKPDTTDATFAEDEPHDIHENGDGRHEENATERTPLLAAEDVLSPPLNDEGRLGWFWVLKFALVAVFPAVIMLQIMMSLLAALGPTVVEGTKPLFVYSIIALTVLLTIIPLTPFAHKLPLTFFFTILVIGLATAIYTTFDFPFAPNAAFRMMFKQSIDLESQNTNVTLTGLRPQLQQVLKEIPSINYDQITWTPYRRTGVYSAEFAALTPRSVPKIKMADWVNITTKKTGISSALIRVSGQDTRACRLEFERGYNVSQAVVRGSSLHDFPLPASTPVKHVNLWRRRGWNGTWEVEVEFTAGEASYSPILDGKVSCIWSDRSDGKIPALDELYVFFPTWATMSAWPGGLVEGWKRFSI